jgi:hypothetical protein
MAHIITYFQNEDKNEITKEKTIKEWLMTNN